jgi:hypothetical protein
LIKNETEGAKNKGHKAHGANMYLTLKIMNIEKIYFFKIMLEWFRKSETKLKKSLIKS